VGEYRLVLLRDVLLALAIGAEALALVIPPWSGLGWSPWVTYLVCPALAFLLAMRLRWSRAPARRWPE
jgi:hypothetical protein